MPVDIVLEGATGKSLYEIWRAAFEDELEWKLLEDDEQELWTNIAKAARK